MEPPLVAILDRYILDVANTKYAISLLPPGTIDNSVPGGNRTLTDVIDHVTASMASIACTSLEPGGGPQDRLDRALAALINHCRDNEHAVDVASLESGSRHLALHGLDIIVAAPEIQFDPLMLNWLLYADYTGAPAREAQQRDLLQALRERYPDPEGDNDAS